MRHSINALTAGRSWLLSINVDSHEGPSQLADALVFADRRGLTLVKGYFEKVSTPYQWLDSSENLQREHRQSSQMLRVGHSKLAAATINDQLPYKSFEHGTQSRYAPTSVLVECRSRAHPW